MEKPVEPSDMPPLTETEHVQLRAMEREFRGYLSNCTSSYDIADPQAAWEYARTFAVRFYDFFYNYYNKVSETAYQPYIRSASEKLAFGRVYKCLDNFSVYESFLLNHDRSARLKKTISERADRSEPLQRIMPVVDSPKIPILGATATDSPLLKMAKLQFQFFNPVATRRKAFVEPLLDAKGWSVAQWAEAAKVSRHTAKDYMEAKRKTNHSNRRLLADALGVSFQEFPK
jgi:lambda repressor-like predicted transcriptional regulator